MFLTKNELSKLPEDSSDIYKRNMVSRYIIRPQDQVLNQLCYASCAKNDPDMPLFRNILSFPNGKSAVLDIFGFLDSFFFLREKWSMLWPQIKPPQVANCHKFPGICGEDCDLYRVIRGKYSYFNESSFIYQFFNHLN